MSLYDDASLAMIPSGIKNGKLYSIKPSSGVGDFTFTRGSNLAATRVDENGLIEKGRENLLLQSNNFTSVSWVKLGAGVGSTPVVTSGFSDPDGGSNAWRLQCNLNSGSTLSDQSLIYQFGSKTGIITFSYYIKSNTGSNQTLSFGNSSSLYDTVTVTSEWQRFEVFLNCTSNSNSFIGLRGTLGSDDTLDVLIYAAQVEFGLVATDYIETGATSEQAGILENLPRLDYTDSSCPSLLLEPTRTNLITNSEYFGGYVGGANATIVTNYNTSPDGNSNASLLYPLSSGTFKDRGFQTTGSSGYYTFSCFLKSSGKRWAFFRNFAASNLGVHFDLQNGVVGTQQSGYIGTIEDYGNGWYRCIMTSNFAGTNPWAYIGASDADNNSNVTANSLDGILIYGAQLEAGSYPTSYIPTYGTSVTRSGDVFDLTNIQSKGLFGTESGFAFYDFKSIDDLFAGHISNIDRFQHIDIAGVGGGYFRLRGFPSNIILQIVNLSASVQSLSIPNGSSKICIVWDIYNFSLFVDGVKIGSLTTTSSIAVNTIGAFGGLQGNKEAYINKILWGNAALTDQEAIALTTI